MTNLKEIQPCYVPHEIRSGSFSSASPSAGVETCVRWSLLVRSLESLDRKYVLLTTGKQQLEEVTWKQRQHGLWQWTSATVIGVNVAGSRKRSLAVENLTRQTKHTTGCPKIPKGCISCQSKASRNEHRRRKKAEGGATCQQPVTSFTHFGCAFIIQKKHRVGLVVSVDLDRKELSVGRLGRVSGFRSTKSKEA